MGTIFEIFFLGMDFEVSTVSPYGTICPYNGTEIEIENREEKKSEFDFFFFCSAQKTRQKFSLPGWDKLVWKFLSFAVNFPIIKYLFDWFSPRGFFQGHWPKILVFCVIKWRVDFYLLSLKNISYNNVLSLNFFVYFQNFIFLRMS